MPFAGRFYQKCHNTVSAFILSMGGPSWNPTIIPVVSRPLSFSGARSGRHTVVFLLIVVNDLSKVNNRWCMTVKAPSLLGVLQGYR